MAAFHCKAGKGRTGTIISCYLLHTRVCSNSTSALDLFGSIRTSNRKGVTIPSQQRYVKYYEICLKKGFPTKDKELSLKGIHFYGVPLQPVSK